MAQEGPVRQIRAIAIEGGAVPPWMQHWPLKSGDKVVGHVSSAAWSADHDINVAIGMVRMTHWDAGTELVVHGPVGPRGAVEREAFWA